MPGAPTTGPVVVLVSRVTGSSIGVSQASTLDGARIVQVCGTGAAQQWRLVSAGSGFIKLINVNSGKALDDTEGSLVNGTDMQQWTSYPGNRNQQWTFTHVGGGFYTITNHTSGLVLDLRDGGLADGTAIQQWKAYPGNPNQQWRLVPVN